MEPYVRITSVSEDPDAIRVYYFTRATLEDDGAGGVVVLERGVNVLSNGETTRVPKEWTEDEIKAHVKAAALARAKNLEEAHRKEHEAPHPLVGEI